MPNYTTVKKTDLDDRKCNYIVHFLDCIRSKFSKLCKTMFLAGFSEIGNTNLLTPSREARP